jgi:hypothetical protein
MFCFRLRTTRGLNVEVDIDRSSRKETWSVDLTSANLGFEGCKGLCGRNARSPGSRNRSELSVQQDTWIADRAFNSLQSLVLQRYMR